MRTAWIILLALTAISTRAQEIGGRVMDEKKEPVVAATVKIFQYGIQRGGTITDYDGNYIIKQLPAGTYDVVVVMNGYNSMLTTSVPIADASRTIFNCNLLPEKGIRKPIIVTYKTPNHPHNAHILTKKEIEAIPTTVTPDIYSNCRDCGRGNINIGGARSGETTYIVDGVVVKSDPSAEIMSLRPSAKDFHWPGHYSFSHNDISYMPATNVRDLPFVFSGITMR